MKITEFFNILKGINFDDEYDYLSVHFAGNYTGGIRCIKVVSNKVILSGEHDPHGFTMGFFDLYSKIKKLAQSADTYDYDVVYFVPSKGTYNVEGAKKNHYDYSYDGDGVYDCCDIYCSDEATSGGTDDIKSHNLNHESYNKSQLFEKILNESSLKESECSLEQLLSKAHISEYKMVSKNSKPTIMKEYVSNQITNTFMRHGVEKYFHEYIIVVDDDWYTPCEFISENGLEDSFGPEYVFEQVVIAVKLSIRWLKNQGIQPDENDEDVSYNLWEMIDFIGSLKENTMENKKHFHRHTDRLNEEKM